MAIRSDSAQTAPEQHPVTTQQVFARDSFARRCRRSLASTLLAGAAAAALVSSSGCSLVSNAYKQVRRSECLDEFMLAHRNRTFALKAWYRERDCHLNERHLNEFKAGFLQGYAEVAEGGNGCSPCTAPSQYWGWRYQSPDGQAAIDAWFAGYPLGAKAAEMDGVGNWGYVQHAPVAAPKQAAAAPAEAPKPVEAPTPIYGPDGRLLPPGQELREYVVPGTERVVPPSELEGMKFDGGTELLAPPTPKPMLSDEAATVPVQNTPVTNSFASAETLVPANRDKVSSTPETYSLQDLGDDAIEDIFGSVEMIGSEDESSSQPATSTADAGSGIPFKFE
ncbi:MAG: hypothetical protein AAFV88_06915 [Planctomycetota bacterium]